MKRTAAHLITEPTALQLLCNRVENNGLQPVISDLLTKIQDVKNENEVFNLLHSVFLLKLSNIHCHIKSMSELSQDFNVALDMMQSTDEDSVLAKVQFISLSIEEVERFFTQFLHAYAQIYVVYYMRYMDELHSDALLVLHDVFSTAVFYYRQCKQRPDYWIRSCTGKLQNRQMTLLHPKLYKYGDIPTEDMLMLKIVVEAYVQHHVMRFSNSYHNCFKCLYTSTAKYDIKWNFTKLSHPDPDLKTFDAKTMSQQAMEIFTRNEDVYSDLLMTREKARRLIRDKYKEEDLQGIDLQSVQSFVFRSLCNSSMYPLKNLKNDLAFYVQENCSTAKLEDIEKLTSVSKFISNFFFDECMKSLITTEMNQRGFNFGYVNLMLHGLDHEGLLRIITLSDSYDQFGTFVTRCYTADDEYPPELDKLFGEPLRFKEKVYENPFLKGKRYFDQYIIPVCSNLHFFLILIKHEEVYSNKKHRYSCYVVDSLYDEKDRAFIENILSQFPMFSSIEPHDIHVRVSDFETRFLKTYKVTRQESTTCGYNTMLNAICIGRDNVTQPIPVNAISNLYHILLTAYRTKGLTQCHEDLAKHVKDELIFDEDGELREDHTSVLDGIMQQLKMIYVNITTNLRDHFKPESNVSRTEDNGIFSDEETYKVIWNMYMDIVDQYKKQQPYTDETFDVTHLTKPMVLGHGCFVEWVSMINNNFKTTKDCKRIVPIIIRYVRFEKILIPWTLGAEVLELCKKDLKRKTKKTNEVEDM